MMVMDGFGKILLQESKEILSASTTYRRCVSLNGGADGSCGRFSGIVSSQFRCKVGGKCGHLGTRGKRKVLDYSDVCILCLLKVQKNYPPNRVKKKRTTGVGLYDLISRI